MPVYEKLPRLIATDLDGTALFDSLTVTRRVSSALRRASELGAAIVPVTGRTLGIIPDEILDISSFAITSNGSAVYDLRTGEAIITHYIPHKDAAAAWKIMSKTPDFKEIFVSGTIAIETDSHKRPDLVGKIRHHMKYFNEVGPLFFDSVNELLQRENIGIEKMFIPINLSPETEAVREALRETGLFQVLTSGNANLEVTAKNAAKGRALRELCERLDIAPQDVAAFGDEENDYTMIEYAGYGVAVSNCCEMLRAGADFITSSNKEDGVAVFLENKFGI